jgi:hypothetical protein
MKNWQALGQAAKVASSRRWVAFGLALLFGGGAAGVLWPPLAQQPSLFVVGPVVLLTWYVSGARPQARYVFATLGASYSRKGWLKPVALAVLFMLGFFVFVVALAIVVALFRAA